MKIAADLDDTIIAQHKATIEILNKEYGYNIDYNKIRHWNMKADGYDIDKELILDIVYYFKPYHCEPTDYKLAKYFNKIGEAHKIDIVTARWGPSDLEFEIYFTLGGLGIRNWDKIILCKNQWKQEMGYDLIIDDNPNLANNLIKDWNGGAMMYELPIVIVFNQPWNWSIECEKYPFLYRANNWKQVYKIIKSL